MSSSFKLPTNIKQIGSPKATNALKIYMEDYVCTYLRQYGRSGVHTEKIAFLVGKYIIIDGEPFVFISGAIQGKHSQYQDNMESFTEESYAHAQEELEKYFPGCEILGWMQSQPGYGVHLNPSYADYHMKNFTRPYHLLFVMDPSEKLNLFYNWNEDMSGIDASAGYFVYYDQNKNMQDYINDNRVSAPASEAAQIFKEESPTPVAKVKPATFEEPKPQRQPTPTPVGRNIKPIPLGTTVEKKEGKSIEDMRRLSNLLVGLCAVLFITTFIMGAGLLQGEGRLSALEDAVVTLDSNNLVIADQLRQMSAVAVFAPSNGYEDTQDNQPPANQDPTSGTHVQPPASNVTPPQYMTPPPPPPVTNPQEGHTIYNPYHEDPIINIFANVPENYTIQSGDSLLQISRMFFGDTSMVSRIMEINNIADANMIQEGQIILLPQY